MINILKKISINTIIFIFSPLIMIALLLGVIQSQKQIAQALLFQKIKEESSTKFVDNVESYRDVVKEKLKEENINEEYVTNILAIIQVSTLGNGTDVMQTSDKEYNERYANTRGSILDPVYSIEVGIKEFKKLLDIYNIEETNDEKLLNVYDTIHLNRNYINFLNNKISNEKLVEEYISNNNLPFSVNKMFSKEVDYLVRSINHGKFKFIYPLKDYREISSKFGYRVDPVNGMEIDFHTGIDFPSPYGTEVRASADGIVENIGFSLDGYGNKIVLKNGSKYKTLYGHLSGFNVKHGQEVKKGDVIGYVGSTGNSTGNHIHFEIILDNKKQDPLLFLEKEEEEFE